jgi:hypothetical protein
MTLANILCTFGPGFNPIIFDKKFTSKLPHIQKHYQSIHILFSGLSHL